MSECNKNDKYAEINKSAEINESAERNETIEINEANKNSETNKDSALNTYYEANEVNEIKEFNDLRDEGMNLLLNDNDIDCDIENKKNFIDYIITVLNIVSIMLFSLSNQSDQIGVITYIAIMLLFTTGEIIAPWNSYHKNTTIQKKSKLTMLFIRIGLVIILAISLYLILLSKRYDYRYTYWVCAICISLLIIESIIEVVLNNYKERKRKGKRFNLLRLIGSFLALILFTGFMFFYILQLPFLPQKQIHLENMKVPDRIVIYKQDYNKYGRKIYHYDTPIYISNQEDIHRIISELEGKTLKSLILTDQFNYGKMKAQNAPYFIMNFEYQNKSDEDNLFDFRELTKIVIINSRYVAIESLNLRDGKLMNKSYKVYPVSLTNETLDIIFTYLDDFTE